MPRRTERQINIKAPAAKVYSYLTDFERHAEWAAHPLRIQRRPPGPVVVGSTFTSVGRQFGSDHEDRLTVTDLVPNEKIVFESAGGSWRMRHYFLLMADQNGTRLTKGVEVAKHTLGLRLILPIARLLKVTPRAFDGDLRRIKAILERVHPAR